MPTITGKTEAITNPTHFELVVEIMVEGELLRFTSKDKKVIDTVMSQAMRVDDRSFNRTTVNLNNYNQVLSVSFG